MVWGALLLLCFRLWKSFGKCDRSGRPTGNMALVCCFIPWTESLLCWIPDNWPVGADSGCLLHRVITIKVLGRFSSFSIQQWHFSWRVVSATVGICFPLLYFFRVHASIVTIVLGSNDFTRSIEVSRGINQTVCHPLYNAQTYDNDICLLKLSSPVEFSDYISPVCLAAENSTFPNGTFSWILGQLKGELTVLYSLFQFFLNGFLKNLTSHFSCLTSNRS